MRYLLAKLMIIGVLTLWPLSSFAQCGGVVGAPVPPNFCAPTNSLTWNNIKPTDPAGTPVFNCVGGVGSGANGSKATAYTSSPDYDGLVHVYCDANNLGNGANGWTVDPAFIGFKKCGEIKHKKDDCKPGTYTVRYRQTFSPGGETIDNCCTANFPTGEAGDIYSQSFAHTYAPAPIDAYTSGSGDFLCVAGNETNGIGGWVAQPNFKCLRPTYSGGACTGGVVNGGAAAPPSGGYDCPAGRAVSWMDTTTNRVCSGVVTSDGYVGDSVSVVSTDTTFNSGATFRCASATSGWTLDTTAPHYCIPLSVNNNCPAGLLVNWNQTHTVSIPAQGIVANTTYNCTGTLPFPAPFAYTGDTATVTSTSTANPWTASFKCNTSGWVAVSQTCGP